MNNSHSHYCKENPENKRMSEEGLNHLKTWIENTVSSVRFYNAQSNKFSATSVWLKSVMPLQLIFCHCSMNWCCTHSEWMCPCFNNKSRDGLYFYTTECKQQLLKTEIQTEFYKLCFPQTISVYFHKSQASAFFFFFCVFSPSWLC